MTSGNSKRADTVYVTMTEYRYIPVAVNLPAMMSGSAPILQATQGTVNNVNLLSAFAPTKESIANSMPVQPVLSMNRGPLPISPYEPGYHDDEQVTPRAPYSDLIISASVESVVPSQVPILIPASIASLVVDNPTSSASAASPIPIQVPAPSRNANSASELVPPSLANPAPANPTQAASPVASSAPTRPIQAAPQPPQPSSSLLPAPITASATISVPSDTSLAPALPGPPSEYTSTNIPFLLPTSLLSTWPSFMISSEAPTSSVVSHTQSSIASTTLSLHSSDKTSVTLSDTRKKSPTTAEPTGPTSASEDITETFTSTATITSTVAGEATTSPTTTSSCLSIRVHKQLSALIWFQASISMFRLIYDLRMVFE
ncbi:hypothetical protein EMPS_03245 [Entomortierella parvispora]|uniref:Uncharacterized protein n=1 Tax=Entomortierella parvispora TaxID=205924 RepID=A0A9P3H6F2_9FUNG|nr:hypothetical protein EMPS_03245 [Entomortierella parvispora]